MVGAFLVGHEALAKVLNTLVGTDTDERFKAVKPGGCGRKERYEQSSENLEFSGDPAEPSGRNRVGRHRMHGG
jgi:hypothetical protein